MSETSNQLTFLLRLWHAECGTLRIALQNPTGGKPEGFTNIDDLSLYLKSVMDNSTNSSDTENTATSNPHAAHRQRMSELPTSSSDRIRDRS